MKSYLEVLKEGKKELTDSDGKSTVRPSNLSFIETEHARLRRKQRCIDMKDLKTAMKHGTCEPHYWGEKKKAKKGQSDFVRYMYKDIFYIVDRKTKKEVTCYARPMTLDAIPLPPGMERYHQQSVQKVRNDLDCWTSNTVMVIDTSGSMRTSDMWGTRNRLKSVWFSVALDFLAERLEKGTAKETGVLSIVLMGDSPAFVCKEAPTTWLLYNKIASLYNKSLYSAFGVNPEGHGYFLSSLTAAEDLLKRNSNASCAAALVFLSDGAPSDGGVVGRENILEKIQSLAKSFGRRLTFTAIGIGDEEFGVMQSMVDTAKDYGATAEFKLPSMSSSSLGQTFTSIATTLTTTQTEMTIVGSSKQRKIRDVVRESKSKASEILSEVSGEDFLFYEISQVTRKIYTDYMDDRGMRQIHYETAPLQHPDAQFVAFSKGPFGEGAERFAYRFYEVAADRKTIVGSALVAKESRMVLEKEDGMSETDARKKFVRKFIMTQQIARRLAVKFNDKLMAHERVHKDTPHVTFLDCSIYELNDKRMGKTSVLVENKLDHNKWYKWNSNNGMVNGVKVRPALYYQDIGLDTIGRNLAALDLDKIVEGSDEEEESDDDNKGVNIAKILFTPSQVAQAFSHFSYLNSDCKRLVCDLQGVYDESKNLLQFSDPVIHYYNPYRNERRCVHGRTDRGQNGIRDFRATHSCLEQGHLCTMLSRGFRNTRRNHHNLNSNQDD